MIPNVLFAIKQGDGLKPPVFIYGKDTYLEDFCLSRLVAGISRVCDECPFLGGVEHSPQGLQRLLLGMFHGGDIANLP